MEPVAVITGGSSGIGAALARLLAPLGFRCVLLARGRERLERVAAEVGGEAEVCDVGDRDAVDRTAAAVLARHPRIKLLVNNAGVPGRATFLDDDPALIERVLRINYLGSVWSLRAFLPGLEAATPSDVVNVVSVAGHVAFTPSGPYSAAKHAQLAFSRSTAGQLRRRGVRVHAVSPGFVETEGFPQRTALSSALLRRAVVGPEPVAEHIVDVLRRGRGETFVPGWYRGVALVQGIVPGLVAALMSRSRYGRSEAGAR